MASKWGPTGVVNNRPYTMPASDRQQIELELHSNGIEIPDPEVFFCTLNKAIGFFHGQRDLAKDTKPKSVRKNLKTALDSALNLNEQLNALDGNSKFLLYDSANEGLRELQSTHLATIIKALHGALRKAEDYPMKGRLPEYHRLYLAVDVADAIKTHLGITPTATKEGLFESLLSLILEQATGETAVSVHDLARKALKSKKISEQPGLLEYHPPEDD